MVARCAAPSSAPGRRLLRPKFCLTGPLSRWQLTTQMMLVRPRHKLTAVNPGHCPARCHKQAHTSTGSHAPEEPCRSPNCMSSYAASCCCTQRMKAPPSSRPATVSPAPYCCPANETRWRSRTGRWKAREGTHAVQLLTQWHTQHQRRKGSTESSGATKGMKPLMTSLMASPDQPS
jgi:hypothetical protein